MSSTQTNVFANTKQVNFLVVPNSQISNHTTSRAIFSNSGTLVLDSHNGVDFDNPGVFGLQSKSILGEDYIPREHHSAVEWNDVSVTSSPVIKKRYNF